MWVYSTLLAATCRVGLCSAVCVEISDSLCVFSALSSGTRCVQVHSAVCAQASHVLCVLSTLSSVAFGLESYSAGWLETADVCHMAPPDFKFTSTLHGTLERKRWRAGSKRVLARDQLKSNYKFFPQPPQLLLPNFPLATTNESKLEAAAPPLLFVLLSFLPAYFYSHLFFPRKSAHHFLPAFQVLIYFSATSCSSHHICLYFPRSRADFRSRNGRISCFRRPRRSC